MNPTPATIGEKYGRWTVIGGSRNKPFCCCECGTERVVPGPDLRSGRSKSCGCLNREITGARGRLNAVHGFADTPTMTSWAEMKRRCYATHRKEYPNYGGRGIYVCAEWLESFTNFLRDMGARPQGHTLHRIDNDGPYTKANCCWAERKEQERNKSSNARYSFCGEEMTVIEAAERYGIKPMTLYNRINTLGWTPDRAVTAPVRAHRT